MRIHCEEEPSPFDGAVPVTTEDVRKKKERIEALRRKLREAAGETPVTPPIIPDLQLHLI